MNKVAGWTAAALVAVGITAGGYVATTNSKPDTRPGPDVKIELTIVDASGKEQSGTCSGVYIGNGVVITAKHCTCRWKAISLSQHPLFSTMAVRQMMRQVLMLRFFG